MGTGGNVTAQTCLVTQDSLFQLSVWPSVMYVAAGIGSKSRAFTSAAAVCRADCGYALQLTSAANHTVLQLLQHAMRQLQRKDI